MDSVVLADLYLRIREEERKGQAWQMWLEHFRYMVAGQMPYKSFAEYYDQMSGKNLDLRPDAEILAEVESIRKEMKEG